MCHAIAQQVLECRGHAVQHAAIHFNSATQQVQPNLLSGFLGCQPDNPVQAVRNTFKLHHAGTKQIALQFTGLAPLGDQIILCCLNSALQGALDGCHVVDRLGHHASQLLHTGKAVKFKRVKSGLEFFGLRQTRLHLGFSLQLNITQLLAQAVQVTGHVAKRTAQLAKLNLKSRAGDHDFSGLIDHTVKQLGTHPNRGRGCLPQKLPGHGLGRGNQGLARLSHHGRKHGGGH